MQLKEALSEIKSYIKKESPAIIALHGNLGAGKTYFASQLAEELGAPKHVTSPTFTLLQTYPISFENKKLLVHCDFYRITPETAEKTLAQVGFWDHIQPDSVILIEWPEQLGNILSQQKVFHMNITVQDNIRNYTFYA